MTRSRASVVTLFFACFASCHHAASSPQDGGGDDAAVPVRMAAASHQTMQVIVSGPGRTDAIEQQKVNAPFRGKLTRLLVVDGDRVKTGQVVGMILAQNSEAAIAGARSMLQSARTASEKADAERALTLAQAGAVAAPLRVPESGVVVSHGASEGDLVNDQQPILSIAATDSIAFVASIAQADLAKVRSGESATIVVSAVSAPLRAHVHGILPTASPSDLRAPVRLDFALAQAGLQLGLFGTAHIVVEEMANAPVVPTSAVLRDDVHGSTRVAFVDPSDRVHWREVTPGIVQSDNTQILAPSLSDGERVIVQGQVGLAEGARVVSSP